MYKVILTAAMAMGLWLPAHAESPNSVSTATSASTSRAGAEAGAQAVAGGFGGNGGNVTNQNVYKTPGAIGIPGLAASGQACLGSVAGGGGFLGGSAGLGFTYLEKACESRVLAEQLYRYGMKQQAIAILWYNHPLVI